MIEASANSKAGIIPKQEANSLIIESLISFQQLQSLIIVRQTTDNWPDLLLQIGPMCLWRAGPTVLLTSFCGSSTISQCLSKQSHQCLISFPVAQLKKHL
ncbi:hypothetical protein L596_005843 [Steinernema carpocapsae]|uniref:Uncharacterized protein n=1 Tax=Steinernema carpocapsae TaxID=34508 RepID=A0A4U8V1R6_STECR|nr:hypothetical protein L596_005843 [Steinernema carpocapsae]